MRILGDGPLWGRWHTLVRKTGIAAHCHWAGWIPYDQVAQEYWSADVLVHTSLRDTSGNVVLEALASGVPVVCLDHQGVADIVDDTCGIKVSPGHPRQVIQSLAEAIRYLSESPRRVRALREGALQRAKEYLWSRNMERLMEVYERVWAANGKCRRQAGGRQSGHC